jgi:hypothetical protein
MSTSLTAVLQQVLQNTTNLGVLRQLMTPDVTYVLLNFDDSELKKIEPWAGTHKGPESLPKVFAGIQSFWKTLDFKVTVTIEQGNRVAFFGSFTYKSNVTGKEITSPFSLFGSFRRGQGCLPSVSGGQLQHRRIIQNRGCHALPQRSFGKRGRVLTPA